MVRLFINQEYMSLQDRLIVKNEEGKEVFLIVGKWGRLGDKIAIYSMSGDKLAEVKQATLSLFPKFSLFQNDEKIGTIKKRPGLRGIKKPYVTVSKLNWIVRGDYDKQQFTVNHFATTIMTIEKNVSFLGDFYILNIKQDEYKAIGCILALLLDHYVHKKETTWQEYKQKKYQLGFFHPTWLRMSHKRRCNDKMK